MNYSNFMTTLQGGFVSTVDGGIVKWFNDFGIWGNLALIIISLISAFLMAGIIGFEREYHGHSAGLRTHMLVGTGSALIMIISIYGFGTEFVNRDPARLAAQVISGIGFLGAGTIIQTGIDIKGLTTATTLWLVMAIGLACGSGNFIIAVITTGLAFATLIFLRKIERWANKRSPKIHLVVSGDTSALREAMLLANRYGITIKNIQTNIVVYKNEEALRITITTSYASKATISAYGDELRSQLNPFEIKF